MTNESDLADHVPGEWHDDPERGTADRIERTTSVDDEVTYHPDEEAVELSDGNTRPVEAWLATECPRTAGREVGEVLDERLSAPDGVSGPAYNPDVFDDEAVLLVRRVLVLGRDGTPVSSPAVAFDDLREATPESITLTATIDDFEHTCELPVYVTDSLVQED